MIHAIGAPPQSFWRIDIAPLSITHLSGDNNRWNLTSSGCMISNAPDTPTKRMAKQG
jgi:broad specificity phosphatase PhoE